MTLRKKTLGRLAVTALAAVTIGQLGLAVPANAATTSYDNPAPGASLPNGDQNAATGLIYNSATVNNVSLGSYWLNGLRTFCGEFGTPFNAGGVWSEGADSSVNAARMAWIFDHYPSTPANDAAKAYASHVYYEGSTDPTLSYLAMTADGAATAALAQQMWNASASFTGSYKVAPQLALADSKSGTVTNTQVTTATGIVATPVTLTLSGTGGAVFDATGTNTVTIAAGANAGWHAAQSGTVTVTEETQNLVAGWLRTFTQPGVQKQLASPGVTAVRGVSQDVQVQVAFQPMATSTAVAEVSAGDTLTDVLHVSSAPGSTWIPNTPALFDVQWYYSPVKAVGQDLAAVPASATLFAKATVTATGPGDVTATAPVKADKAAWYYPVASFTKAKQAADMQSAFIGDWTAKFNESGEESVQKFTPQLVTTASTIADGKVSDTLTVSGNYAGQTITVVSNLYLTTQCTVGAAGTDKAPSDAQLIGTVSTDVTGNGTVNTPSLDVPWDAIIEQWKSTDAGCLYWQENAAATPTTNAWTGKHQLPKETVPVTKPSIVTKASANGTVPLKTHDTGVISGTVPSGKGVTVTTQVQLFKFDNSTDGSAQPVCLNPMFTSPVPKVTKAGEVTYPETAIEHEGTYGYVETLKVAVEKDGKTTETTLHTGTCGEKDETVVAFAPNTPVTPGKPQLTQPEIPTGHTVPPAGQGFDAAPIAAGSAGLLALIAGAVLYFRNRRTKIAVK